MNTETAVKTRKLPGLDYMPKGKWLRRPPPRRHLAADLLTGDEVQAILRTFSRRAPTGIRNRALVAIFYRAGLRMAEALDLEIRDLDRENGTLNIRHGKGDRQRFVAMDEGGWAVLDQWLARRASIGLGRRTQLVFPTLRGAHIHQSYVRGMLGRAAKKAGVVKRVHAHGFRHLFAVELSRERFRVQDISRMLGHSSLEVTSIYLSRIPLEETLDYIRRRRWPGMPAPGESVEPAASGNRLTAT